MTKDSFGKYSFKGITIIDEEMDSLEDGALYRSIAMKLEGFYVLGEEMYGNWDGNIVSKVWGMEKPDSWLELRRYVDETSTFISRKPTLGELMSRFQKMKVVDGKFDYVAGKFSFTISDLTSVAQELRITEEMLGYILAMLEEYAPEISFFKNTYSFELEFVGERGIDESDFEYYENWDKKLDVRDLIIGKGDKEGYRYFYYVDLKQGEILENEKLGLFTNRGIQLGQSIDSVIFNHAGGKVENYKTENDIMYNTLKQNSDENYKYLGACTKYIIYNIDNEENLVYYFNDSNELRFVVYTNIVVY